MSDNPYESPAEISYADFSTENNADDGSQRLGWLVCTVLILDCLPSLGRICLFIFQILNGYFAYIQHSWPSLLRWFLMAAIFVSSLSGNLCILLKKRIGIPFAILGIVLGFVGFILGMWNIIYNAQTSPDLQGWVFATVIGVVACFWFGWQILYGFVVWKAAKKLRWFRKNVNPGEREA